MQRAAAIIGSAIFLVIAPGTLAVFVPWYLTAWHFAPPLFPIARVLGAALIVAGLPILLDSFARFALQGLGTPAPVMPPERLVVTGFYCYVRNSMYVAVTALIAGQGLLFGSITVLEYGAVLWAGFFLFVVVYEEPVLDEQFGDEYKRYREREAMAAAHHPMARVGGKDAAGASSRSAAAWLRWPIARQPKGFAVANHRPMPVAMMKAPSMTPTARKNLVCRSVISSG